MADRKAVEKGVVSYSCNCGWIDTKHFEDQRSRRFIGAANLWQQLYTQGISSRKIDDLYGSDEYPCSMATTLIAVSVDNSASLSAPSIGVYPYDNLNLNSFERRPVRFSDGGSGFFVTYEQDGHQNIFGIHLRGGVRRKYLVRCGLSLDQRRAIGLAILKDVTNKYEQLQGEVGAPDSSFAQDDFMSNLLSYYVGSGLYSAEEVLQKCKVVDIKKSLNIFDAVGMGTNDQWNKLPLLENVKEIFRTSEANKVTNEKLLKRRNPCPKIESFSTLFSRGVSMPIVTEGADFMLVKAGGLGSIGARLRGATGDSNFVDRHEVKEW